MKFGDLRVVRRFHAENTYLYIGLGLGVLAFSMPMIVGLFSGSKLSWASFIITLLLVAQGFFLKYYEVKQ